MNPLKTSPPPSSFKFWPIILAFLCLFSLTAWFFWPKPVWNPIPLSIQQIPMDVWVAQTRSQHRQGLRGHSLLHKNQAMLFIFEEPRALRFWMPPDMKFPIDLVFLNDRKEVVAIYSTIKPCQEAKPEQCERYWSTQDSKYALELQAGRLTDLNVQVGDFISITYPQGQPFP